MTEPMFKVGQELECIGRDYSGIANPITVFGIKRRRDGVLLYHTIDCAGCNWLLYEIDLIPFDDRGIEKTPEQKQDENLKDTNPKDAIGVTKIPFHLWPETATIYGAIGFLDGMLKYGRSNWRKAGVRVSVYYDACRRHLNAYFEGEENTPDTGLPHLACALACIAILIDAKAAGKLVDDRMYPGGYHKLLEEMTPHITRLKELHKDKDPKHWTIQDKENPEK